MSVIFKLKEMQLPRERETSFLIFVSYRGPRVTRRRGHFRFRDPRRLFIYLASQLIKGGECKIPPLKHEALSRSPGLFLPEGRLSRARDHIFPLFCGHGRQGGLARGRSYPQAPHGELTPGRALVRGSGLLSASPAL